MAKAKQSRAKGKMERERMAAGLSSGLTDDCAQRKVMGKEDGQQWMVWPDVKRVKDETKCR